MFANELVDVYPDAKVILNRRGNIKDWKQSFKATTYAAEQSMMMWILSFFNAELFWMERMFIIIVDHLFDKNLESNAEEAYVRHYEELEAKLRRTNREYINWDINQGWESICKLLRKDVPDIDFPHVNQRQEHDMTIENLVKGRVTTSLRRLVLFIGALIAIIYLEIDIRLHCKI